MRAGCPGGGKGALVGKELSNTLAGTNDQSIVSFGIGNGQADRAMNMQEELSQTLHCMHDPNAVMCAPINSMVIGKDVTDRQTTGIGSDGEPSPTLQANHHHAVAVASSINCQGGSNVNTEEEFAETLTAATNSSGNNLFAVAVTDKQGTSEDELASPLTGTESCPAHAKVVAFMGGQGAKAGSLGYAEELSPTLKGAPSGSNQVPDVVCQYGDVAGAVTARNDSSPCADRGPTVVCYDNQTYARNPKETGDICCTLEAHCGTGGNTTPFVQEIVCRATQQANAETLDNLAPTLTEAAGTSGNNQPVCFALAENTIGRQPNNGGNGTGATAELGYTLNATGQQGVAAYGFVRRLTTVECARLQGFPDHHTEISWRGKPASDCPQGPQYKAYGNSMCVNVMEWLGRKIQGEIHANSNPKMA